MKSALLWIEGEIVEEGAGSVPAEDRALAYGDGLFETILIVRGRPIWLMAHMDRFRRSAKALGYPNVDTLMRQGALAARSLLQEERPDKGALRVTWTRGSGLGGFVPPENATPRVLARLAPVASRRHAGMRAISLPDLHGGSLAAHKSCSALLYVEAARRARAAGVGEALLADGQGGIAEASAANLFVGLDGHLVTPPIKLPLLPGITRAWVIRRGRVTRRPVNEEDLAQASEAFLTNSISGVIPLLAVDGREIGSGRPGPNTRRLQAAFAKATGQR